MRPSLFWDVAQRGFAFKTCRSCLQGSSSPFFLECCTLEDETDRLLRNVGK